MGDPAQRRRPSQNLSMIENLGVGSELGVDPSTRPDYAEWESLARKGGTTIPTPPASATI